MTGNCKAWFSSAIDLLSRPACGKPSGEIRASGIVARFPGRTPADLFLWMWKHEDDLAAEYACPKP